MKSPLHPVGRSLAVLFISLVSAFGDDPSKTDPVEDVKHQLDTLMAKGLSPAELIAAKEVLMATLPQVVLDGAPSPADMAAQAQNRARLAALPGPEGERVRLSLEVTDALAEIRAEKSPVSLVSLVEKFQSDNREALAELGKPLPSDITSVSKSLPVDPVYGEIQTVLGEIRAGNDPVKLVIQLEEFQYLNEATLAELARPPNSLHR